MTRSRTSLRRFALYAAGATLVLTVAYAIMLGTGIISAPGTCLVENRMTIPNVSGVKFEVSYANCDEIAKQEAISIYASSADEKDSAVFRLWHRRTLLFRYDPWTADGPLPTIRAAGSNRILISVPKVSSVFFRTDKWRNMKIDYEIGQIAYP